MSLFSRYRQEPTKRIEPGPETTDVAEANKVIYQAAVVARLRSLLPQGAQSGIDFATFLHWFSRSLEQYADSVERAMAEEAARAGQLDIKPKDVEFCWDTYRTARTYLIAVNAPMRGPY